jgi:predicted Zn-dependent peptidase
MSGATNPSRPKAGAPRPYHFPRFNRTRLPNGLTLWQVPVDGATMVTAYLVLDAGAAAEDEPHGGVAALTAQLLVTGTARLDAAAFAEATERLGIEVSSESTWDSSRAAFQALPQYLEPGLDLLAEMLQQPRFDASEFERLKAERLADILQSRSDPGSLADETFRTYLYDDSTPYRRASAGLPETVESLALDDVQRFHAAGYRPADAHLVVAGNFDPSAVTDAAQRHLGSWTGSGPGHREIKPRPASRGRRVVIVDRPGSVQSELRIGLIGIDRLDPRYFPAVVMSTALGGMFWSRVNLRLREELGYTYGARCGFDPRRAAGPFSVSTAVHTEVTAPAIRETIALLDGAISNPLSEAELARARDFQVGVFPLRFETTGGIAGAIEPLAVYGLADDYWDTYRSHVEAVTEEDAARVARELIRTDEVLIVAVGDAAKIRAEVEALNLGPLEVVPAP